MRKFFKKLKKVYEIFKNVVKRFFFRKKNKQKVYSKTILLLSEKTSSHPSNYIFQKIDKTCSHFFSAYFSRGTLCKRLELCIWSSADAILPIAYDSFEVWFFLEWRGGGEDLYSLSNILSDCKSIEVGGCEFKYCLLWLWYLRCFWHLNGCLTSDWRLWFRE